MDLYRTIQSLLERDGMIDTDTRKELAKQFRCSRQIINNQIWNAIHEGEPNRYRERNQVTTENARARKLGLPGSIETDDWRALIAYYEYRCLACGEQKPLVIDHVIPLSLGGEHHISNVQPLCSECNRRKWNTIADYRPRS